MIHTFRKKPIEVLAIRYNGNSNKQEIEAFVGQELKAELESETAYVAGQGPPIFSLLIETKEGIMKAFKGDWIIKEPFPSGDRDFYPCKAEIFEKTYKSGSKQPTPEIICMCGSTRFADLMAAISWELEKQGKIVLRVNYVPYWYVKNEGWTESGHGAEQSGLKEQLDELHLRKIDMADRVFICNVNNYIGESTQNEINYAVSQNKPVVYLYCEVQNELTDMTHKLLTWRSAPDAAF